MSRSTQHLRRVLLILVSTLVVWGGVPTASAATEPRYVAATGHYVQGVFRDFWDKRGGLETFGYPITEEYIDNRTGRVVQYYERARFERASSTASEVQLGLLGREFLGERGFPRAQPIANSANRRYFNETGQVVQYGFKTIWETRGGLAIFGLPLSGEISEQLDDGKVRTVQYFERVRFEYHPELPDGKRVLISLLGRKLVPAELTKPLPPGTQPPPLGNAGGPPPSLVRPLVPAAKSAIVYPLAGKAGDVFLFTAEGFTPGEKVAVWLNAPDGIVIGAEEQFTANQDGTLDDEVLFVRTAPNYPVGVWSIVAQGVDSKHSGVAYFLLVSSALNNADGTRDQEVELPPDVDARADPRVGLIGTTFFFEAHGFAPGEEVQVSVTAADGSTTNTVTGVKADQNGSIGYAGLYYASGILSPLGLYNMTAIGRQTGKRSIAYFMVIG